MSVNKFNNRKKCQFLNSIPVLSLESGDINDKCKFNFSYFDSSQKDGQNFQDWEHLELVKLLDKIKNYSEKPLSYWRNERIGGGGLKVLEIYGNFPKRSAFIHPKHVPHDVLWARFRMEGRVRLVGFVVPNNITCHADVTLKEPYDRNTFYVVFLDKNHKFYLTEEP